MNSQFLPVLVQFLKDYRSLAFQRSCIKGKYNFYSSRGLFCRKFCLSSHRLFINKDSLTSLSVHQRTDYLILFTLL